jgi:DnaK suppressor protein
MDTAHYKRILAAQERDLLAEIARREADARESTEEALPDPSDQATTHEVQEMALKESTLAWQTLQQVRDALQRIEDGTYGKCVDCGRPIQPARLEAVPWTPYCIEDQARHDAQAEPAG